MTDDGMSFFDKLLEKFNGNTPLAIVFLVIFVLGICCVFGTIFHACCKGKKNEENTPNSQKSADPMEQTSFLK